MKTVGLASYPKLAADDATGEHYEDQDEQGNAYVPTWLVETNTQRCVLHAQLQRQFHGVLQTSFGELEKEFFSNFAIIHDMTVATDQQPRPMHEENRERNFAFDSRWLNGTYKFLASSARDESGHCFRQKTIQGWR